jgi:catechol 2,3-dioxygenase-like lactoylglutathione lyase family enzyme
VIPAPTSLRLAALTLIIPDYDAAIGFFVGVLGFDLLEDVPQPGKRWVMVGPPGGGAAIVLAQPANSEQAAAIGNQGGGRVWLFLETDDFARDHDHMTAAGVMFEEAPRHEPYGIVAVWRDPFGNRWDLIERRSG